MVSSRARALALVGAAAFLPLLSSAQESRLPRVDLTTPLDKVNELSQLARVRELRHTMLNIFYHTMGAPVTLVKRTGLKADYYDAWRARIHDRAFPKGVIDPSMYTRAVDRRRSMAPAPVMGVGKKGAVNRVTGLADASGALWEPVGPFKTRVPYVQYYGPATSYVSGRVGGIAFDPIDSNIVYKTGSAGGVFKTTNGGVNWTPLVNGIQAPYLSAIAVSPHNRNIVLAGSGDFDGGVGVGDGLYRSINGGASWSLVAKSQIGNVAFSDIVFDPTTPGRVLATTGRRGILNGKYSSGLWESKDYGSTWTKRYITKPVTPETMSLGSISFGAADATVAIPSVTQSGVDRVSDTILVADAGAYDMGLISGAPSVGSTGAFCFTPYTANGVGQWSGSVYAGPWARKTVSGAYNGGRNCQYDVGQRGSSTFVAVDGSARSQDLKGRIYEKATVGDHTVISRMWVGGL